MNILDKIVAQKRIEVAQLPAKPIKPRADRRDFIGALKRPSSGKIGLIAEVKKASPSAGIIRADFDPVKIARDYQAAGAHCLSVLTDEKFFQGSLQYLREIREAVQLPLLRKDFIIDARQIPEAIEHGADAILLIVAILSDEQLSEFLKLAAEGGVAALVEVHDETELDRALAAGATFIGVNNRDLKTFTVDLATTERLSTRLVSSNKLPKEKPLLVAESGIHTGADAARLRRCGAGAILVGEALMREKSMGAKVRELLDFGEN